MPASRTRHVFYIGSNDDVRELRWDEDRNDLDRHGT